jgi:asparagine synthetase B (glutamine-hydrolysing)
MWGIAGVAGAEPLSKAQVDTLGRLRDHSSLLPGYETEILSISDRLSLLHIEDVGRGYEVSHARFGAVDVVCYRRAQSADGAVDAEQPEGTLRWIHDLWRTGRLSEVGHLPLGFLILLVDHDTGRVAICNDIGSRIPVYYCAHAGALWFSPQLKSFRGVPGLERDVDPAALASFLFNGFMVNHRTLQRGVRLLPHGTILWFDGKETREQKYWRIHYEDDAPAGSDEDVLDETYDVLTRSIRELIPGGAPSVGLFLSGGLDCRLLLGAIRREMKEVELHLVTYGHDADRPGYDMDVAQRLARQAGLSIVCEDWQPRSLIDAFTEFVEFGEARLGEISAYPAGFGYLRRAREVSLSWLMGGHSIGVGSLENEDDQDLLNAIEVFHPDRAPRVEGILAKDAREPLRRAYVEDLRELLDSVPAGAPLTRHIDLYYNVRRAIFLGAHKLVQRPFVEVVEPLVERRFLDLSARIPARLRTNKEIVTRLMERRLPEYMDVPRSIGKNKIPWVDAVRSDRELQSFIRDGFASAGSRLYDHVSKSALEKQLELLFDDPGEAKPSKPGRRKKTPKAEPPKVRRKVRRVQLVFRLLILKEWLDRYA